MGKDADNETGEEKAQKDRAMTTVKGRRIKWDDEKKGRRRRMCSREKR